MRVFAGPNGSGKSTVIQSVREYQTENGKVDFGIYINADDIVTVLKKHSLSFAQYKIRTDTIEFTEIANASGLINKKFTEKEFKSSFKIVSNKLKLLNASFAEQLAQIVADFLRKKLLKSKKKFSFETVFSHESKLDIMRQANAAGYKVYLYFVSANSSQINVDRVALRVAKGGHDVPKDKIIDRYVRSLDFLFEAAQLTYQTFFFDNSKDQPELFAQFKINKNHKAWKLDKVKEIPDWFITYYADKIVPIKK